MGHYGFFSIYNECLAKKTFNKDEFKALGIQKIHLCIYIKKI